MKHNSKVVLVALVLTLFSFFLSLRAFAATDLTATELPVPPEFPVSPAVVSSLSSGLVLSMQCNIVFGDDSAAAATGAVRCMTGTATDAALVVYEKVDGKWKYVDKVIGTGTTTISLTLDFVYDHDVEYKGMISIVTYDSDMNGSTDNRICEKTAPIDSES